MKLKLFKRKPEHYRKAFCPYLRKRVRKNELPCRRCPGHIKNECKTKSAIEKFKHLK